MDRREIAPVLGCVALALNATPALAETWARAAETRSGIHFDVDVDSLSRKGALVQSWMRETPERSQRASNGRAYSYALTVRYDDCDGRRYQLHRYYLKDARGAVVAEGNNAADWNAILPGSVAEGIWRTNCALTSTLETESLLDAPGEGRWESLGLSADKSYELRLKADDITKLESGYVVVFTRSDYRAPQPLYGFYASQAVAANLIDCENARLAYFGTDVFVGGRRVHSFRTPKANFKFETMAPGSFAYAHYERTCANAIKASTRESAAPDAKGGIGFGTGWAVAKGYIVTSSHVVTGGKSISVYSNGERIGTATIAANDPANDLAVLRLRLSTPGKLSALSISDKPAVLGRSVFTLGYPVPGVMGQRIKMAAGEISSTSGLQDDARQLQISVPIQQGNSGGPVMGWDGTVVGVVDSKLSRFDEEERGPSPEAVNYAVKASYLRPLLEDLPDLGNYVVVRGPTSADELVDQARKAVFMLVVEE